MIGLHEENINLSKLCVAQLGKDGLKGRLERVDFLIKMQDQIANLDHIYVIDFTEIADLDHIDDVYYAYELVDLANFDHHEYAYLADLKDDLISELLREL